MKKEWTKQDIEDVIKDYMTRNGGVNGTSATSLHRHTGGGDGLQIRSSDLIPYTISTNIFSARNNNLAILNPSRQGSIELFDFSRQQPVDNYYNWGMNVFLGNDTVGGSIINVWSELNLADFYVNALQSVSQTIAGSTIETIIFDIANVSKPNGAYDAMTGIFSVVNNQDGKPQTYTGYKNPVWYLVTASVGVVPSAASLGESIDISVVVDGSVKHTNTFYFVGPTEPIIATISVLLVDPIQNEIHIEIDNGSANSIDTTATGPGLVTYFKIKQLK